MPAPVTRLMSELSGLVDRARFDAASTTDEHAALAWALADAALDRLGPSWRVRLFPVRHPLRAVRRLRATRGQPRRRTPWQGEVPDSALVTDRRRGSRRVPGLRDRGAHRHRLDRRRLPGP